ncbi:MAG: DUF362 domain-containing protein [Nitrospirota bacterium]|nr:DUF362 domain-containing protein [Nitrospirota bacterium]
MSSTISLIRCSTYEREEVDAAVRRAIALIGGISLYVRPGQRVLIKPNLLKAAPPEAAVTTHPEIVRTIIRMVREAGATALVGDSPGIGDYRKICQRTGILAVAESEGAKIADFSEAVEVKNAGRFQRFEIARAVAEADVVINVPKFKTHGMTVLTGAVKNLFGCIPGKRKVQWHFNSGVDHGAFTRMLVELSALVKPGLSVMDAIIGMEGNGPGSGDPRAIGAVLAGVDPVALDVVAGALVGLGPEALPILKAARDANIGETDLARISQVGDELRSMQVRHFKIPPRDHTEWRVPDWLRRTLKEAFTTRPVVDQQHCVRCGICVNHCPRQAIHYGKSGLVFDYRNCIRCYCCQEFCPQGAITVGRGWALKILRA